MLLLCSLTVATVDYNDPSTILTFPDQSPDGSSQCVNVSTIDDMVVEMDETFDIMISSPSRGVVSAQNSMSVFNITDPGMFIPRYEVN